MNENRKQKEWNNNRNSKGKEETNVCQQYKKRKKSKIDKLTFKMNKHFICPVGWIGAVEYTDSISAEG